MSDNQSYTVSLSGRAGGVFSFADVLTMVANAEGKGALAVRPRGKKRQENIVIFMSEGKVVATRSPWGGPSGFLVGLIDPAITNSMGRFRPTI